MSPGTLVDARRSHGGRDEPFRARLVARRARTEAVAIWRVQSPLGGAGRRIGPRLGHRPAARGLRSRRQGDAGTVPDGEGRTDPPPAEGSALAHPRRRSCAAPALAAERGCPEKERHRAGRRPARRLVAIANSATPWAARSAVAPCISTPRPLLRFGAAVDRLVRRDKAKLTPDRVAYFCHPDWVVSASSRAGGSRLATRNRHRGRPEADGRMVSREGLAVTLARESSGAKPENIVRLAISAGRCIAASIACARLSGLEDRQVGKRDVDPLRQLAQRHPAIVKHIVELDDDRHDRSSPQDPRA